MAREVLEIQAVLLQALVSYNLITDCSNFFVLFTCYSILENQAVLLLALIG